MTFSGHAWFFGSSSTAISPVQLSRVTVTPVGGKPILLTSGRFLLGFPPNTRGSSSRPKNSRVSRSLGQPTSRLPTRQPRAGRITIISRISYLIHVIGPVTTRCLGRHPITIVPGSLKPWLHMIVSNRHMRSSNPELKPNLISVAKSLNVNMEDLPSFLAAIGEEVEDAEEESFLLFAQDIPSANLGFVDSRATTVDVTIHGQDYTIHQSPTLLSSSRAGGTTGAVLWKITPLFAEWISALQTNPLWRDAWLTRASTVVELGCGISGLIALALAPAVHHYIATDQDYVQRLLRENLAANAPTPRGKPKPSGGGRKRAAAKSPAATASPHPNITFTTLDWELDVAASLRDSVDMEPNPAADDPDDKGFDLLLSCDCIYNEALVAPFVRTCADICGLRPAYTPDPSAGTPPRRPTICIIAQQQRSPDVFEAWLQEAMRFFRVWRVRDEVLGPQLRHGSGYLVHLLLLREHPLPGRGK